MPDTDTTLATTAGTNFDQVIANALAEDGIIPPGAYEYVIEQARLETNNYTSNVFLSNNNINGYKFVPPNGSSWQDGQGLESPEGDYYGNYDSVENSVHETSYWWQRRAAAGFSLASLTSRDAFVGELEAAGWFTSGETAYELRMASLAPLISLQNSGINTQGTGLETIGIGVAFILGLGLYAMFNKK